MRTSRLSLVCISVITVAAIACAKSGDKVDSSGGAVAATDTGAKMAPMPAPAPALNLASVAGTWNLVSRPASGSDTTSTRTTLNAKADTTGWTMVLGKNKPVALHVRVSGDSIIESSDAYPSVRRKGQTVKTTSVFRLQGGKLAGTTTAHYAVKTADSVLVLNTEGTKAP